MTITIRTTRHVIFECLLVKWAFGTRSPKSVAERKPISVLGRNWCHKGINKSAIVFRYNEGA